MLLFCTMFQLTYDIAARHLQLDTLCHYCHVLCIADLASTMVQSGLIGDVVCPWDWLLSLLSFWASCSCQTLLTHLWSVQRWSKLARFLRVTEVSLGLACHDWQLTFDQIPIHAACCHAVP